MTFRKLLFALGFSACVVVEANPKSIDVAVISSEKSVWHDQIMLTLAEELNDMGGADFNFRFAQSYQPEGELSLQQTKSSIDRALRDQSIDIVIALGVLSSSIVSNYSPAKPLIATTVIDAKMQGFPLTAEGTSGKANLHYLTTNVDLSAELKRFQQATGAEHIGILGDASVFNAIPRVRELIKGSTEDLNFKVTQIRNAENDVNRLIDSFPQDLDALFVLPQVTMSRENYQRLIDALTEVKMPTYATTGRDDVAAGFLMGTGMIPSPSLLARQLAVDIRDIVLGRSAADLSVSLDVKSRLYINMAVARAIDFSPPFNVLFEAETLSDQATQGRLLSLFAAVEESLKRNLSLAIAQKDLESARQDTRIARAPLLPQLGASATRQHFDRDLVATGPTRTSTVEMSLSQSIYSESNRSRYTANRFLEKAQAASFESTRLDVIQITAESYLNVLVAKTERDIQRDNLKLTRANLERAQFRYEVGSTNRSEVHRFETELGNDQQSITAAQSAYQQALNRLNQVLHRPIDEAFQTQEPGLDQPKIFGDERLITFLRNPRRVKIFSDFLTQRSLQNSPELVSLTNEIASQKRLLLADKRKRYVPDVDMFASMEHVIDDEDALIETNFDEDWTVGVQFSWQLFQGLGISAEKKQSRIQLQRAELLYKQTADAIETSTRNSIAAAGASRISIDYARSSESAAEKTLNLVTDAYVRGTASYVDLIDAQSAYLIARLSSANAIYAHLLDLIALQRAIGFFDFYVAPSQKEAWFDALNAYAQTYGKNP